MFSRPSDDDISSETSPDHVPFNDAISEFGDEDAVARLENLIKTRRIRMQQQVDEIAARADCNIAVKQKRDQVPGLNDWLHEVQLHNSQFYEYIEACERNSVHVQKKTEHCERDSFANEIENMITDLGKIVSDCRDAHDGAQNAYDRLEKMHAILRNRLPQPVAITADSLLA